VTKTTTTCYKHDAIFNPSKTKPGNTDSEFMNFSDNISNNEFENVGSILQEVSAVHILWRKAIIVQF
jgi:hypothetical protein